MQYTGSNLTPPARVWRDRLPEPGAPRSPELELVHARQLGSAWLGSARLGSTRLGTPWLTRCHPLPPQGRIARILEPAEIGELPEGCVVEDLGSAVLMAGIVDAQAHLCGDSEGFERGSQAAAAGATPRRHVATIKGRPPGRAVPLTFARGPRPRPHLRLDPHHDHHHHHHHHHHHRCRRHHSPPPPPPSPSLTTHHRRRCCTAGTNGAGGVTTVFEFPVHEQTPCMTAELLSNKAEEAEGRLWVDVALVGLLSPGQAAEQVPKFIEAGAMALVGYLTDQSREVKAVKDEDDWLALLAACRQLLSWTPTGMVRRRVPCMVSPMLMTDEELEVGGGAPRVRVRQGEGQGQGQGQG